MLSTVTTKGQVTIPKPIRDAMGIGPNDRVAFIREGDRVILQPLRTLKDFRGAVKMKSPGSFPQERLRARSAAVARIKGESE